MRAAAWFEGQKAPILILLWLSAEFFILGPFSAVYVGDCMTLFPTLMVGRFLSPSDANWNSLTAAGWDRVATMPMGFGNYWLFQHAPAWLAYQLNALSQMAAAFGGAYGLARWRLGTGVPAALAAASLAALDVNGQIHLISVSFFPAVILALCWTLEDKTKALRWLLLATLTLLIAAFAWISELMPFYVFVVATWFLFVERQRALSNWMIILAACVLPLLLRLGDVQALMDYSTISHRDLVKPAANWADYSKFAERLEDNHVIVAAGLFFLAALSTRRLAFNPTRRILSGIITWSALIVVALPVQILLMDVVPQLRGYTFERLIEAPRLLLLIGSALGMQALLNGMPEWLDARARKLCVAAVVVAILAISLQAKYNMAYAWITQGNIQANFNSDELRDLARLVDETAPPERIEAVQMYSSYLNAYGMETAGGGPNALFSRRYYEFWDAVVEPMLDKRENNQDAFGSGSPELFARTGDWPRFRGAILMLSPDDHASGRRLGDLYRMNLLNLANVGWLVSRDRLGDADLRLVKDAGPSWSDLSTSEKIRRNAIANFRGRSGLFVYKNAGVMPRFFAAQGIELRKNGRDVLETMARMTTEQLRERIVVSESDLPKGVDVDVSYSGAKVRQVSAASDHIELEINDGEGPTLLFVSNAFSPFWTAAADGKPVEMFAADHAFWGVVLPAGTKRVVFQYQPNRRH